MYEKENKSALSTWKGISWFEELKLTVRRFIPSRVCKVFKILVMRRMGITSENKTDLLSVEPEEIG